MRSGSSTPQYDYGITGAWVARIRGPADAVARGACAYDGPLVVAAFGCGACGCLSIIIPEHHVAGRRTDAGAPADDLGADGTGGNAGTGGTLGGGAAAAGAESPTIRNCIATAARSSTATTTPGRPACTCHRRQYAPAPTSSPRPAPSTTRLSLGGRAPRGCAGVTIEMRRRRRDQGFGRDCKPGRAGELLDPISRWSSRSRFAPRSARPTVRWRNPLAAAAQRCGRRRQLLARRLP